MDEFFVYGTFFGVLLFLFPIFVYIDSYADIGGNKVYFAVSLYRVLRVFGGYGELRREGIAIHLTKKYAVFLPYSKLADTRKKFEITEGFQLWRFHQVVETGGAGSVYSVLTAAAIQSASGAAFSLLRTRHPFLSLKNSAVFSEKPCLKLTTQTAIVFNGLILLTALIKKALEALINWIRKRKSTASWKRQPSN